MSAATSRMIPIFPTPIFSQTLGDGAALTRDLLDAIQARRTHDRGVSLSNVGGWQSPNTMTGWGGEAARRLADAVVALADRVTTDVRSARRPVWKAEMWANVNRRGDSNQSHWHPGSYLSAVYYVQSGYDASPDTALGGELVFIDPRMPYLRMRTPDLHHRSADGKSNGHETWLRPHDGLLVLFPSYLSHSVRPYRGDRERITIAINLLAEFAAR